MADFDPFANQGGPAAWDPEHGNDSKKLTDELLKKLTADAEDDGEGDGEPGAGPPTFTDDSYDTEPFDADTFETDTFETEAFETDGD